MSTIANLPSGWTRVRDSTRWRIARGGIVEAEASFRGPGESYAAFLTAVGGLEETITYPDGSSVSRLVPLKFPSDDELFDSCYAIDCEIEGAGLPSPHASEGIRYAWGNARVYFSSSAAFNFGGDYPLITYSFNGGADQITRPGTAYRFPSDDLRLNHDVGVLVPWRDFSITFHQLLEFDEELWDSLTGRVNSEDFYHPNGRIYGPGFIQYLGAGGTATRNVGNVASRSATHRFKLRYIKHNEIMRPDGTAFEAPVDDNDDLMIPTADLMGLYTG